MAEGAKAKFALNGRGGGKIRVMIQKPLSVNKLLHRELMPLGAVIKLSQKNTIASSS